MSQYAFLTDLEAIIDARLAAPNPDSYTAELAAAGLKRVAQLAMGERVAFQLGNGARHELANNGFAARVRGVGAVDALFVGGVEVDDAVLTEGGVAVGDTRSG